MTAVKIQTTEPRTFSKATMAKAKKIIARYPKGKQQSAVIPLLKLAQDEFGGWLDVAAMELVAETLNMPYIRVYEVATFYTMFNLKPVGKYHLQLCTNCSCMINGSAAIGAALKTAAGLKNYGETSADGLFTLSEVECLGACVEAPMMQINSHYHTKLTPESAAAIIAELKSGTEPKSATPTAPLKEGY